MAQSVCAENLPDPTRPPPGALTLGAAVASSGPVLQSVLISPGRKTAIISGETVRLGGKYGAATVIRISESEVVLNHGGNLQTLRLFPEVEKKTDHAGAVTEKKTRRGGVSHGAE
ncbi:MAG TPA: MSHA biogenesis protein MshK [Burkholderiales bacterium]|nr:MSHA biogenesis protein MshK [Burkholderiales bacterium]